MDDVWEDFLGPPHGTTPAAVLANKIKNVGPLKAVKYPNYVACPKSPVTHAFYSERIAETNQSYSSELLTILELILLYNIILTSMTSLLQLPW